MFTFGSDPEFMLTDSNGKVKSAINIVKKGKDEPIKIGKNLFFYDNVVAECTIKPAKSKKEAVENIRSCLVDYNKIVKPFKLTTIAAMNFPQIELNHKDALKAGCDKETCAYTVKEIKPPKKIFRKRPLRVAGGHIHLGFDFAKKVDQGPLFSTRILDLFLGIPSIYLDKDKTSKIRKTLYGKAGRFRQTDYGIEYRTLGNFWLNSPELVEIIFDLCEAAIDFLNDDNYKKYWTYEKDKVDWNNPNYNPANVHKCHAYNVEKLIKCINEMNSSLSSDYLNIIQKYLKKETFNQIKSLSVNPDLYINWNIK